MDHITKNENKTFEMYENSISSSSSSSSSSSNYDDDDDDDGALLLCGAQVGAINLLAGDRESNHQRHKLLEVHLAVTVGVQVVHDPVHRRRVLLRLKGGQEAIEEAQEER